MYKWTQPPYFDAQLGAVRPKSAQRSNPYSTNDYSPFASRKIEEHYSNDEPLYVLGVPEQKNGSDCGLYLLEYTKLFLEDGWKHLKEHIRKILDARAKQKQQQLFGNGKSSNAADKLSFESVFKLRWKSFPSKDVSTVRERREGRACAEIVVADFPC